MEPVAASKGRKRGRKDVQSPVWGPKAKRHGVATRGKTLLVGRYVKKCFESSGVFLGKIVSYETGLYRVDYEDGDCEDLDGNEVKDYLVEDGDLDKDFMARKCKLDKLITKKYVKHAESTANDVKIAKESFLTEISNGGAEKNDAEYDDNSDVSSYSFDQNQDEDLKAEVNAPVIPLPQLPPSSGDIGVPGEYVSYLLSVYGFFRSFSIELFLSPFSLDDFVGSLNCPFRNTLLDAIHVALMRVLKRHFEMLASDGSELALKCMRLMDWSLLDTLTWPIYLVQYLMIMRHIKGPQWKGFYIDALEEDYYSLPIGWKLMILQVLCDDVLESVELRSELDIREEAEVGIDPEAVSASASEMGPKRVHPRYTKTSCKNEEAVGFIAGTNGTKACYSSSVKGPNSNEDADSVDDGNVDECRLCGMDGTLLCCDGCPSAYHPRCIGISKMSIPEGTWYCPECAMSWAGLTIARGTSLTGAKLFGTDSYGHIYFGTCDHLLVLKDSTKAEQCFRHYHHNDIPKVLKALVSSPEHVRLYSDICKGIIQYWDIQRDAIAPFLANVGFVEQTADIKDNRSCTPIIMLGGDSNKTLDENKKLESLMIETGVEDAVVTCLEDGKAKSSDVCCYEGLQFNPQTYTNVYIHGDFAASAAANLAVLSSEEKGVSESHALDKRRKNALADSLLQVKAFSSVAVRFFWPTVEKKLVEVPRERCSWCLSCKASGTSKKACLLNAAASNAIKGAMKILSRLPALTNRDESLCAIGTYLIFMEESLCGLVVGAFRNTAYRNQWRKRVERATTLKAMGSLLLELENNIRAIALSLDWFKLVDSWLVESSMAQSVIVTGSTQKRGLGGRRGRKPAAVSEAIADDVVDSSVDFTWWRGGIFSKFILQRGVLPHSIVKKAARQGGCRKIPGIVYVDGSEIPERSRQYFWRAAVERSKNASELAVQVRRLDHYVRWNDLVRPEQTVQNAKGQENEASAFRNAFICEKKEVEMKITYGVAFRGQKHLPSRVLKNIIEVEQSQNGKEKYWFSERHVPLYLIKDYEEKVDKMNFPLPDEPAHDVTYLQKRELKACHKDIFTYLCSKRDNLLKCSCASCQVDVVLRDAVKCNECEGFCHERCTIGSTIQKDGKVEHQITCKLCHTKSLPQSENESPNSPLLFQGQHFPNTVTASEGFNEASHDDKPLTPAGPMNSSLKLKFVVKNSSSVSKKRQKIASWGLIFKKIKDGKSFEEMEKEEDDGIRFRMNNILGKRNSDVISGGPQCHLCDQPYDPGLMYILCDTCENWYHTDALEFDESKLPDLVGFKCCKCRRTKSPLCPYSERNRKKTFSSKKSSTRSAKRSISEPDSPNLAISDLPMDIENTPMFPPPLEGVGVPYISGDDPLRYSSTVDQLPEPCSEMNTQWNTVTSAPRTGPQKLPVRRLTDNNKNSEANSLDQAQEYTLPPCAEWGVPVNGFRNDFKADDMEFEPQTYFSFNDLLAPDEANAGTIDCGDTYMHEFENANGGLQNGFVEGQEACGDAFFCLSCYLGEPSPDLCCQICGVCYHSYCSPWVEEYPLEVQWRCGNCRERR